MSPLVEVESVRFTYPDGRLALDGVDFRLGDGERVALLGPNGAGKTTLGLHLNGILRPGSGHVRLDGLDVIDENLTAIRRVVGLVFQDPNDQLFMPTVTDDVAFGPANLGLKGSELDSVVEDALEAVGATHLSQRVPHHLSGGEKRMAAIATVLAMGPRVLVLDEPGSGLDPAGRREMITTLAGLDVAMLIITHDIALALELCPRAVIMDQGRVVADMPTEELLGRPELLQRHRLELPYGTNRAASPTYAAPPMVAESAVRNGLKWTYHPPDVLPAWVAEMDFGLAPPIATALHDAVDRADTGYAYPDAERAVAESAVEFWARRLDWKVEPERVFPAPDVIEGIRRAIVHLTEPGSPVVLHTPVYFPFFSMVERAGRDVIQAPSRRDDQGRYRLDLDAIQAALKEGAGSVVLCNPWNPTGRSLGTEEVAAVVEVASQHSARVISDEVHAAITFERRHQAAAPLGEDTVITVTSASKAWNLPGLKCAQVVLTNDADAEFWAGYFTPEKVGVGTFGLIANAAAYREGQPWLEDVMDRLRSNRGLLDELVETHLPDAGYTPPEATYLAWLDLSPYGLDNPAGFLLEEAHVALTDGGPFGKGGEGHVRLNFATHPELLIEMIERMAKALGS